MSWSLIDTSLLCLIWFSHSWFGFTLLSTLYYLGMRFFFELFLAYKQ